MKKTEQVYREILYRAMEQQKREMTQLELSKTLRFSLSTVNAAIRKLAAMGAVRTSPMQLVVLDIKKILYLWASIRNIERDRAHEIHVDLPVREIERLLPNINVAAYTAYKFRFREVPADYSEVYVYASDAELKEMQRRFKKIGNSNTNNPNLIVLRKDMNADRYGKASTQAQLFVDLWNLKSWYAADFLKALEARLLL